MSYQKAKLWSLAIACLAVLISLPAQAQENGWDNVKPFTAFKVIGNIYYVGDEHEAVYLITTSAGHILLDTGYEDTVPIIKAGVEKLGFQMKDIKIMISGHAHSDHV